jgi:hypothetical protein
MFIVPKLTSIALRLVLFLLFAALTGPVTAQVLTSSNLPIVELTIQQPIPSMYKINGSMKVYYHANGARNYLTDTPAWSGIIGIETRGSSSSILPKKCYDLELRDAAGLSVDAPLLGMPAGSDWILYASHNDKSLMRTSLSYKLYNDMGNYAVRTRHCEVILDGQYIGVYIFTEKIRRGPYRVNIADLDSTDLAGIDVTGGYVLQKDHQNGVNMIDGILLNTPNMAGGQALFEFWYPDKDRIQPAQISYIKRFGDSLQQALYGANFDDPAIGYRNYMNVSSFIDYWILYELSRNADGFTFSTFFTKPKDNDGRKLIAGPPWDFDLSFRNASFNNACDSAGFLVESTFYSYRLNWWNRLFADTVFANEATCRWVTLRQQVLSLNAIFNYIDSTAVLLGEGQQRNFTRWPIMNQYVLFNQGPFPQTYEEEIDTMKAWIARRVSWLDRHMPGICRYQPPPPQPPSDTISPSFLLFPNPFHDVLHLSIYSPADEVITLELLDAAGRRVDAGIEVALHQGINDKQVYNFAGIEAGLYFLKINSVNFSRVITVAKI